MTTDYRQQKTDKIRVIVLFLLIISVFITGIAEARELRIGLIPEQNVFRQMERYKPLGEYIYKKTGIKIKFTLLSRYGNIIDRFHEKNLDGAFWGSFTGAMAIEKLGIIPVARPVNLDGTSSYHGYILVRKDSNIRSVSDMRGKVIAFVERATTAGYVFPRAYFREHGVKNIDKFFREYYFTGSHDAAIYAVLNGEADIACAKNTIYELVSSRDPRIKKELLIIARSPDVPSNGLGLKKDISKIVREKIKTTLLEMHNDPEGQKVLKKFRALRFIETKKEDYSPVFNIARKAGINLKEYVYRNE